MEASAQGYPASEAASRMTLPDGLEATLVAAEPMVRQPVAIEFDDRGRLWVVQYLQYPNPAGLKRAKVDRYSRTTYDRVPEPPPKGPRGADRVTILIDEDADGRAESSKDFIDGLNLASGLGFGHGGVFIIQPPYLLFYPDRDRDDRPDADPDVLLTGFGMEDAHAVANSLTWGPDGWLYGCQGSTVTSRIRGTEFQQGVWRYHPKKKAFELFCEGGGNAWGMDFDATGNLFVSTNFGPYLMIHAMPGAYYWKSFAKHGELHNPYAYGYFDHAPHEGAVGGHVTVGGLVYQGSLLPEKYRGKFIGANLLSHAIYWHEIVPDGSTFRTRHGGTILESNDASFAPSDLTTGPDGALYVADWNDKRTAHPDPDADWDRTTGRIYRIAPKGAPIPPAYDLGAMDGEVLAAAILGTEGRNLWFERRAAVALASIANPPEAAFAVLRQNLSAGGNGKSGSARIQALWALAGADRLDDATLRACIEREDGPFRMWAIRFIAESQSRHQAFFDELLRLASESRNPGVRAELAAGSRRIGSEPGVAIAWALAQQDADAEDPFIPLLLWWSLESRAIFASGYFANLFEMSGALDPRIARETLLPRFIRRYAAEGTPEADAACARLLAAARKAGAADAMLADLEKGLSERGRAGTAAAMGSLYDDYALPSNAGGPAPRPEAAPIADELIQLARELWRESPANPARLSLMVRLGDADALAAAAALAADSARPSEIRIPIIGTLGQSGNPALAAPLLEIAEGSGDSAVRIAALGGLRGFASTEIADRLLSAYPQMSPAFRAASRETLLARKEWTAALLRAVDAGTIDAAEVTPAQLRHVALYEDDAMNALVKKHWGTISGGTPEEKLATVRRFNNDLRAAKGNPARGREYFEKTCAKCHAIFGAGGTLGPDLTQSNRMDSDFLLVSMVDPSAVIRKEYLASIVEMKDGGIASGIVVERGAGAVTLVNAEAEKTTIPMDRVKEIRESAVSIMPEDLLAEIKPDELRDLVSYLQSADPAENKGGP